MSYDSSVFPAPVPQAKQARPVMNPFHRSKAIAAALKAALALPLEMRAAAIANVPEYRSRGKGWRKGGFIKNCLSRTQNPKPSGWDPHIGDKQIAKGLKHVNA